MFVAVEKPYRQGEAGRRQSSRQPPRFDHIGVVEHGVDRMRGVLRAEKLSALLPVGEPEP